MGLYQLAISDSCETETASYLGHFYVTVPARYLILREYSQLPIYLTSVGLKLLVNCFILAQSHKSQRASCLSPTEVS